MTKYINLREQRAAQLQAFYTWLPAPLHVLPGMDWSSFPGHVLVFCVRSISNSPDAGAIALAAGAAMGKMRPTTLWSYVTKVHALLGEKRRRGIIHDLADLASRGTWEMFAQQTEPTHSRLAYLQAYSSLAGHSGPTSRGWTQSFLLPCRRRMRFPPCPWGFSRSTGTSRSR